MNHLDLFSGIGGFALAADQVWPNVEHVFCDNDTFCQAVLKKHWPQSKIYGDIRTLTNTKDKRKRGLGLEREQDTEAAELGRTDLITGGFPCQPFSQAGRRKGTADDRHLWPEMFRVIRETLPRWVVGENVRGFVTWNQGMVFESVCADLESIGYEVQPIIIPACATGAPHRRDRVWIIANRIGSRRDGREAPQGGNLHGHGANAGWKKNTGEPARQATDVANAERVGRHKGRPKQPIRERQPEAISGSGRREDWFTAATRLCSLDDGLPNGLVRPRGWRNAALKAAGNAIVPAVAVQIFSAIKLIDQNEHD